MNVVYLLLDSLNRAALSCYGNSIPPTPAFNRLAERGVVFDNHYVGSLPCMPARRDLLTGRLNFTRRSWGPVEPFDRTFPEDLHAAGVYSHLISDHYHYWETGGAGYHNQYSSAEFVRGQERDLWKAMVAPPIDRFRAQYHPMLADMPRRFPNMVNRAYIRDEEDFPTVQCIKLAREFLEVNASASPWMLQVELFDPHEPFIAPQRFRENLPTDYVGPILDWPIYDRLDLSAEESAELRANYLAVVAMCDHYLGKLLDDFDRLGLWDNTAIVLTTDHGFLLGEQDWWGKNRMPMLDPVAHIPLVVCHPESKASQGQRRRSLSQCLDVPATILDMFGINAPTLYEGRSLLPVLKDDTPVRSHALFGIFGGALNITDGEHVYFRYPSTPQDSPLFEYTLMPVHPQSYFTRAELESAELVAPTHFSDGMPLLKIPARDDAARPPMQGGALADARNAIYNLKDNPAQDQALIAPDVEQRLTEAMISLLAENDAPKELYERFDLSQP